MTHSFTSVSLIYAMALERARYEDTRVVDACLCATKYARNALVNTFPISAFRFRRMMIRVQSGEEISLRVTRRVKTELRRAN